MFSITNTFIFLLIIYNVGAGYCPHYCKCLITNGLRHVKCVGQRLISVDLDVPRTAQWLELSNNSIYELQDKIFEDLGLENIEGLNMDNNAIQSIGLHAFASMSKLQFLDLSGNHLYHIPSGTFKHNPVLSYLSLKGNPLRYLKRNQPFIVSQSLSVLDISHCRINYIPDVALTALSSLIKLNISSNHIGLISIDTLQNLTQLQELDISNNELECNTVMRDLIAWLESNHVLIHGSPCLEETPPPFIMLGQQFERMVVTENTRKEFESEFDDYMLNGCCSCTNDSNVKTNEQVDIDEVNAQRSNNRSYNPLFLLLAFVNGLIVGAAASLSFWICSRWLKAKRRRHNLNSYSVIQYDGPPPAYSDLF